VPQPGPMEQTTAAGQPTTPPRRELARNRDRAGQPWGQLSLSPNMVAGFVKIIDVCMVLAAAEIAFGAYHWVTNHPVADQERHLLTAGIAAVLLVTALNRMGGYTPRMLAVFRWQLLRITGLWATILSFLLMAAFLAKVSDAYSRGWAVTWAATSWALVLNGRGLVWLIRDHPLATRSLARKIVVVGAGEHGTLLLSKLINSGQKTITIRGVFDDRKLRVPRSVCGCDVLGTTDELLQFARETPIDEVVIALPLSAEARLKQLVSKLKVLPIDLRLSIEPVAESIPLRGMSYLGEVPLLEIAERPLKDWSALAKWLEDKLLGSVMLLSVAPMMAIIALLIRLESPGPVLFVQARFGFNNKPIRVLKFRTMYADLGDVSGAQRTVPGDPRVTRVGRVLRSLSLDELPQLINVLRGEMSLVGPRPHAVTMKAGDRLYSEAVAGYLERHRVKPGMTGWAQVNGLRGEIDTLAKARARVHCDLFYIERWSVWLDVKILALTLPVMLSSRNAY
jgi:Undecaprenyl-phosphate glucose phosphotransferase